MPFEKTKHLLYGGLLFLIIGVLLISSLFFTLKEIPQPLINALSLFSIFGFLFVGISLFLFSIFLIEWEKGEEILIGVFLIIMNYMIFNSII